MSSASTADKPQAFQTPIEGAGYPAKSIAIRATSACNLTAIPASRSEIYECIRCRRSEVASACIEEFSEAAGELFCGILSLLLRRRNNSAAVYISCFLSNNLAVIHPANMKLTDGYLPQLNGQSLGLTSEF